MGRPPSGKPPAYQRIKGRDLAMVRIAGKAHYLGKPDTPESWEKYHRLLAEHAAGLLDRPEPVRLRHMTVAQLAARFTAERVTPYYPAGGSSEPTNFKYALARVTDLYGSTPLANFGPRQLKAVRDAMAGELARTTTNRNLGRIRQMFRWAAAEGFYRGDALTLLQAVEGVKAGRMGAREPKGVGPVSPADVAKTLPFLSGPVAAMVRVQLLTGMRPGEVRALRWADLDTKGEVWTYRPGRHKTKWRGKSRVVQVGPQAQAVLLPFRRADAAAPLFSPRDAVREHHAARGLDRRTPLYPCEVAKHVEDPGAGHAATYSSAAYRNATVAAAKRAGVPPWHPNQLRHAAATEVRARFGLEAAQAVLGHARPDTTLIYAERDEARAREVAREIG